MGDKAKIKLVFQRTAADGVSIAWTETEMVEVEVPKELVTKNKDSWRDWHLTGMIETEEED